MYSRVWELLSEPRMEPYRRLTSDEREALKLYEWSACTSAAVFEVVGHLEVLLRNAIDKQLREHVGEANCGIPWFLMPTPGGEHVNEAVQSVRERLRPLGRESRHQIVAGLSFGFWAGIVGSRYEELWRDCVHRAFPNSTGRRKQVSAAVEGVREFRNRLAHHDSMLKVDVPFEIRRAIEVAGYIDSNAAEWLESVSRAMRVYAERPVTVEDTVVVAARDAWSLYRSCYAYVCQAGRTFRPVERIAFYADREVKPEVPRIIHRRDNVEWTEESARRLAESDRREDRKIAAVISAARSAGWDAGVFQVFLLTRAGDSTHRSLARAVPHPREGRGSAFTQRQRYVSLHALETATSTDAL